MEESEKVDATEAAEKPKMTPEIVAQLTEMRDRVQGAFGQVAMAMMALPRYKHLSIGDLQQVLLEPLIRDRVALAQAKKSDAEAPAMEQTAGVAIWASVSEEVDAKIREQIKAGVFPVRLTAEDWNSGEINWLLDVIAPTRKLGTSVIANFKQVIKTGDLRIHPLVTKLVDDEALRKMGAAPIQPPTDTQH